MLILERIVTDIKKWMLHRNFMKVLNEKQKEAFLLKMETLMRFKDQHNALPLLSKYFEIIYTLCSNRGGENSSTNSSSSTSSYHSYSTSYRNSNASMSSSSFSRYSRKDKINIHLKIPFMSGLLSPNPIQRRAFFELYSKQLEKDDKLNSVYSRLQSVLCQDWDPLNSRFWLPLATECVLSGRTNNSSVELDAKYTQKFPPLRRCLENINADTPMTNTKKRRREGNVGTRLGTARNDKTLQSPEKKKMS
jgi:hypothetical protein